MSYKAAMNRIKHNGWTLHEVVRVNGGLRLNCTTAKGKPRTIRINKQEL